MDNTQPEAAEETKDTTPETIAQRTRNSPLAVRLGRICHEFIVVIFLLATSYAIDEFARRTGQQNQEWVKILVASSSSTAVLIFKIGLFFEVLVTVTEYAMAYWHKFGRTLCKGLFKRKVKQ